MTLRRWHAHCRRSMRLGRFQWGNQGTRKIAVRSRGVLYVMKVFE